MNKNEAKQFLSQMYQDIVSEMNVEKIPDYFSSRYIQITDGNKIDLAELTDHMLALKEVAESITVSPFHEFLFDEDLQTATLRYTVEVVKKSGNCGRIELIAIFKLDDYKIVQCHELSNVIEGGDGFDELASINEAKTSSWEEEVF
ncbi:nuclear transport factor 2 family protein [Bacillus swezeyi]|uniref:Metallopeptidase n=1 Tax=Bacillus swezeyi TaxID=1925020 RepID=A0A1R1QII9_9BACI|nr:metallopeptidase [Bacillus swezeyi]MEC1259598.1 nuclear transport factor 2 family protein [Bacillus swezeyi]MED2927439.1 nuclear transport factor 2 family protein [Bacillus swezeyi]MED2941691.1 nuclear transport factor 2 family protein [Bacillus swezeyi]MED2962637.1 nuclear transport factor 2 family protein [Bacillus swezeyi]MED2977239.1 nuclear transport factor 2 family protein [Bacillus swezeyi]